MHFIRQSTASQVILLGPFVDSTDGSTAETALTINASDIKIWKHGATTEANKNSGGATHIAAGRYYAVLDATDTNTVGMLEVNVSVSGALPVRRVFMVIEEAIYDMLFASSANGDSAGITTLLTRIASALTIASGRVEANVTHFNGAAGTFASGRPEVNTSHWGGTAVASATVRSDLINIAGSAVSTSSAQLGVNVVNWGGAATGSANVRSNLIQISGSNVSTSSAQLGVNVVNWGGTATGSAIVRANTLQLNGDATAAQNAELFFDGTGYVASNSTIGTVTNVTNAVTAGTVTDKTGYSLTQSFPTNFSSLSIDGSGNVTALNVSAIKTVTDRLDTALELDGAVYRFTSNALEQAPSSGLDAAGIRSAVGLSTANLDVQLSGIQTGVNSILGSTGSTLSAIPWNPAWDAEVQFECAAALAAYAPLTSLGSNAPAGWINAASIATSALNGKGDWNIGKTGYSLSSSQTFNLTGNITGNLSGSVNSVTSPVTAGTVSDKTGYSLTQTFPTNFSSLSIDGSGNVTALNVSAIKTVTDKIDTAIELDGAVYRFTASALEQAPSSGLDAAGVRAAVGLASANLDTQLSGIQSGVTSILAFNGSTFASIPWNAAWDAKVQSACADALAVYAPLTTLGANAPAGWINAAAIASSALNGKGDWNVGKTGYSLSSTQSFNLTGNITGNLSGSVNSVISPVTAGTVSDKTGYSLTQSFPANFASLLINSSGHVSRVTLSDTCTINTDMRGTDNAALAAHWTSTRAEYLDSVVLSTDANHRTVQVTGSHYVAAVVHDVQPDAIDAAAIASSAIAAIQAGLATSSALATAQADLDIITGASGVVLSPNSINAAALASDAVAEIQAGLATASALATAQADLDIITGASGVVLSPNSINAAALASDAVAEIRDAVFAQAIESGVSFLQAQRAQSSILAGLVAQAGTGNELFKAAGTGNSGTTRLTVTVDRDGNRTGIIYNL